MKQTRLAVEIHWDPSWPWFDVLVMGQRVIVFLGPWTVELFNRPVRHGGSRRIKALFNTPFLEPNSNMMLDPIPVYHQPIGEEQDTFDGYGPPHHDCDCMACLAWTH